jgi:cytidylate kinase
MRETLTKEGITMAVITISRQKGSRGDIIAKMVAERLQYQYVDKTKISDAMANQGLPAPDFEKFDGKKPTIWQSMTDQKKKFTFLLRATVYDFARDGNAVILGRGGQALLKDIPGTLHVRIVAPLEIRRQRLMDQEDMDPKMAEQLLLQSDRDSSGFIRSFFDIDWRDENFYDLLVNTRALSVDIATALIVEAASAPEIRDRAKAVETSLADKALVQKARAVLVGFPGVDLTRIEVAQGVVTLSGLARSKENIESCRLTIMQLDGVQAVRNKLEIVPMAGV